LRRDARNYTTSSGSDGVRGGDNADGAEIADGGPGKTISCN